MSDWQEMEPTPGSPSYEYYRYREQFRKEIATLTRERDEARREVERLRAALAPFAELEKAYRENGWPDHVGVLQDGDWVENHVVTMGQLRAARAALEGQS